MTPDNAKLLDCAIAAARLAGTHALRNSLRRSEVIKSFEHDVKLALDVECQQIATEVIVSQFPGHCILGEEDASVSGKGSINQSDYQWVIDPIDGTVNFSHGLSNWCCSIAVRHNGIVLAGAVYIPVADELYTATIDGPANKNGKAIHVSSVASIDKAIILTGVDRTEQTTGPSYTTFMKLSAHTQKTRVMGAAAADICQVAAGRADGYYESGIYIWDIAAAGLILERAGGMSDVTGRRGENMSFLATNGLIHSAMKRLVS